MPTPATAANATAAATAAAETAPADTEVTELEQPGTDEQPAAEEADGEAAEGQAAEATDPAAEGAADPAAEPAKPVRTAKVLKQLDRYRRSLDTREAALSQRDQSLAAREQSIAAREAQVNPFVSALERVKDDPVAIAHEIAKAAGWTPEKLYQAWTHRLVNDTPSPEELERRSRAAVREEIKAGEQQRFQAQVDAYVPKANQYVTKEVFTAASDGTVACKKFPLLSVYTPESVAKEAIGRVVNHFARTGVEIHLDVVLKQIEDERRAELSAAQPHLQPGGETGRPSERGGAAQAANHDAAGKPKTVTNRHAASTARAKDPDEMTDQERHAEAVRIVRAAGTR